MVVCNEAHRFLVAEQLRQLVGAAAPRDPARADRAQHGAGHRAGGARGARGRRPAAAGAAGRPRDPRRRGVPGRGARRAAVGRGGQAGHLRRRGRTSRKPATATSSVARAPGRVYPIERFVEKPDAATARQFVAAGDYYWNSGMFLFRASRYPRGAAAACARTSPRPVARRAPPGDATSISSRVGRGRCSRPAAAIRSTTRSWRRPASAVVVPLDAGWSDVGSWSSLHDAVEKDARGNVQRGDVIAEDTDGCFLYSQSRLVAAVGLKDHVVVETKDAVLVAPRDRVQDVKLLAARLKASGRYEHSLHREVYRPWGSYDSVESGRSLPGEAPDGEAGRVDVAAAASPPGRALDRGLGHGADHAQRRGLPARGEPVDLHSARREAPHREPGQDHAAHHRGAVGRLPGRGRHRALRGSLRQGEGRRK